MLAFHHAKTAVTASSRSRIRFVNIPRCREYCICDTGVVKQGPFLLIYDTGLIMLLVHQHTVYLVRYWNVLGI